jgi:two-component system phosphate regulon sensor histidine kinase PhoR
LSAKDSLPENHLNNIFKPSPLSLFAASVAIIFVAEALVMFLLFSLEIPDGFSTGIIDACILSLFVVPTLYYMLFKPMRQTIERLDKSEEIQRRLHEADKLKSDFISIASHELCTPVATINGYTDILLDNVHDQTHKGYLEIIQKKTVSLERIIDDLQVVDNLESGQNLLIKKSEDDIKKTLEHVANIYQTRLPDKPIRVETPVNPVMMSFDETRISQVLDNLLSNAIKYDNTIHDVIDLSLVEHDDSVEIVVRDEGIGMTPDEVKQIFKKFFRAETEKSVVGGLGLGMAIVKNIIDGHDGTIDIVSQRKVGTTVTVTLPKS